MDILNDDCLELVFSYLTLKEKCIYECVSKRWKRLMFKYQNELDLSEVWDRRLCPSKIQEFRLACNEILMNVTSKCPFIEKLILSSFGSSKHRDLARQLEIVGDNCVHLAEMVVITKDEKVMDLIIDFGRIHGRKLRQFHDMRYGRYGMITCNEKQKMIDFLSLCPNLERVTIPDLWLKENDPHFLPKLNKLEMLVNLNDNNIGFLSRNERYFKCLVDIKITDETTGDQTLSQMMAQMHISGNSPSSSSAQSTKSKIIDIYKHAIQYCGQTLKSMDIIQNNGNQILDFSTCSNLKTLNLNTFSSHFPIENMKNIVSAFTNLISIEIKVVFDFCFDLILQEMSKLVKLESVSLCNHSFASATPFSFPNNGLMRLMVSCPQLMSLSFDGFDLMEWQTAECMIGIMRERPRIKLTLNVFCRCDKSDMKPYIAMEAFHAKLKPHVPDNMIVREARTRLYKEYKCMCSSEPTHI